MRSGIKPTVKDIQNFIAASLITGIAFAAIKTANIEQIPYIIFLAGLVILSREIGQRIIAQWMDAYIDLRLSKQGSATTLFGALAALITDLSIILLFPLTSKFSVEKHEQWGKSVDAIWAKRQYWLTLAGLTTLLGAWTIAYTLDYQLFAELAALFMFFQLMPFDYKGIPTGKLDGAYILLWSGFTWLITMGITIIILVLTFY